MVIYHRRNFFFNVVQNYKLVATWSFEMVCCIPVWLGIGTSYLSYWLAGALGLIPWLRPEWRLQRITVKQKCLSNKWKWTFGTDCAGCLR